MLKHRILPGICPAFLFGLWVLRSEAELLWTCQSRSPVQPPRQPFGRNFDRKASVLIIPPLVIPGIDQVRLPRSWPDRLEVEGDCYAVIVDLENFRPGVHDEPGLGRISYTVAEDADRSRVGGSGPT
jgi:hypothetical protein